MRENPPIYKLKFYIKTEKTSPHMRKTALMIAAFATLGYAGGIQDRVVDSARVYGVEQRVLSMREPLKEHLMVVESTMRRVERMIPTFEGCSFVEERLSSDYLGRLGVLLPRMRLELAALDSADGRLDGRYHPRAMAEEEVSQVLDLADLTKQTYDSLYGLTRKLMVDVYYNKLSEAGEEIAESNFAEVSDHIEKEFGIRLVENRVVRGGSNLLYDSNLNRIWAARKDADLSIIYSSSEHGQVKNGELVFNGGICKFDLGLAALFNVGSETRAGLFEAARHEITHFFRWDHERDPKYVMYMYLPDQPVEWSDRTRQVVHNKKWRDWIQPAQLSEEDIKTFISTGRMSRLPSSSTKISNR